jgi:hypothetical protein
MKRLSASTEMITAIYARKSTDQAGSGARGWLGPRAIALDGAEGVKAMEWLISWGPQLALAGAVAASLAAIAAALGAWGTTQQQNRDQLRYSQEKPNAMLAYLRDLRRLRKPIDCRPPSTSDDDPAPRGSRR